MRVYNSFSRFGCEICSPGVEMPPFYPVVSHNLFALLVSYSHSSLLFSCSSYSLLCRNSSTLYLTTVGQLPFVTAQLFPLITALQLLFVLSAVQLFSSLTDLQLLFFLTALGT